MNLFSEHISRLSLDVIKSALLEAIISARMLVGVGGSGRSTNASDQHMNAKPINGPIRGIAPRAKETITDVSTMTAR